jgi:hypothetical protein
LTGTKHEDDFYGLWKKAYDAIEGTDADSEWRRSSLQAAVPTFWQRYQQERA